MSIVFLLVPIAVALAGGFLIAFIRESSRGEFEDLETPAHRMLIDEEEN